MGNTIIELIREHRKEFPEASISDTVAYVNEHFKENFVVTDISEPVENPFINPEPIAITGMTHLEEEVRTTSETGGQKGSKLARFDLIPPHQLWRLAEHYGKGAEKYSDDNYRKGYPWKYSIAALERHIAQFKMGEDIDDETGSLHLIAAAWHCFSLAEFFDVHPNYDTRLKTVDQRALRDS